MGETVEFPSNGHTCSGYLATPRRGRGPGVVVIQEYWGLVPHIRNVCDRFAEDGFVALAPDLYSWGGKMACLRSTFRDLRAGRGRAFEDIGAAQGWMSGTDDCTGKVGIIGFCMGGGFALLTAPRGFDVSAPNYSPLPADLDDALAGSCPVVASFGGRDRSLPGAADKVEAALTRLGVPHDVREYPAAGHSFMNRHNAGPLVPLARVAGVGYHHPSAEDAWGRILRFFETHLRG